MECTIMEGDNTKILKGYKSPILPTAHVAFIPKLTAPTSSLPPLGRLVSTSTEKIATALINLRSIYFPPPPPPLPWNMTIPKRNLPKHLMHGSSSVPDSGYASADDEDEGDVTQQYSKGNPVTSIMEAWTQPEQNGDTEAELELLRADSFERAFAIKWITGFIARCDAWVELVDGGEDGTNDGGFVEGKEKSGGESVTRERLVEEATRILSSFSGGEEEDEFAVTRTFEFSLRPSSDPDEATAKERVIKVELNDAPLLSQDHTSVGLQSWASSIILAERMTASPSSFSLHRDSPTNSTRPLRILELGAGTGLLSITAAKIWAEVQPRPLIVATDYHPDVLDNLQKNVYTNFLPTSRSFTSSHYPIHVQCLDWEHPRYDTPLDERFDIILGADVVYHPNHARWIKNCVENLLRLPGPFGSDSNGGGSGEGGVFWMMVAVRSTGRHEGLHATVDEVFTPSSKRSSDHSLPELVICDKEEVKKQGGVGRSDEGSYVLFKIGWNG